MDWGVCEEVQAGAMAWLHHWLHSEAAMHYFTYDQDFAAVEDAGQAAKYAVAGWCVASRETFIDAWKRRDARDLDRMRSEVVPVVVMETAPIKNWMPAGYRLFHVRGAPAAD